MAENLFSNYYELVSVLLFGIGFTTLLLHKNLVKKVLGLNILNSAVLLFLAAKGYVQGGVEPIVQPGLEQAELYVNPVPTGLILTGIVISVSMTAFALALILSLYKRYETLDLDKIIKKVRQTEGEC